MGPDARSRKHIMNFSMICISVCKKRGHRSYCSGRRALEIVLCLYNCFPIYKVIAWNKLVISLLTCKMKVSFFLI